MTRQLSCLILAGALTLVASAAERHWPAAGRPSHGGTVTTATGAVQDCVVLDGLTTIQATDCVGRQTAAVTAAIWVKPYGCEHDGKLYVVYSVGKEDCGLSIIPIGSRAMTSSTSATATKPGDLQ